MLKSNGKIYFILLILLSGLLISCNSSKLVQKRGGLLLTNVSIANPEPYLDIDEIDGFILQKPVNGNMTFFHPGVSIYEGLSKGKQTKVKSYFKKIIGEQPVILDTTLARQSVTDIIRFMNNKGFYDASARYQIIPINKTSVKVKYLLEPGQPYHIKNLIYISADTVILTKILQDTSNSLLHNGNIYDIELMDDERDRITKQLKNQGYLTFIKSYITYLADSSAGQKEVNLTLIVNRLQSKVKNSELIAEEDHPVYEIRNIYIKPDQTVQENADTSYYKSSGSLNSAGFFLINENHLKLRPTVFKNNLFFHSGELYNQQKLNNSYRRLLSLAIIQSASINLIMPDENDKLIDGKLPVDCIIKIARNPVNSFSVGAEGTNSGGNLGLGANMLFQNKNIFRSAELFRLKVNGGAEIQGNIQAAKNESKLWVFNTLEYGVEAALDFPRMVAPFRIKTAELVSATTTTFSMGNAFETRPDYTRTISTFSVSYKWNTNERVKHIYSPFELNFVNISTDSAFNAYLKSLSDPLFLSQYSNHLLSMMRYSLIYTQPGHRKLKESLFLRINAEAAGNVLYALDKISGRQPNTDGYYTYFNVRYSQFVRTDADLRFFWPVSQKSSFAMRIMGGIGIPYANAEALPFEKTFWLGGANDMRSWKLRSLGPGGFKSDIISFDHTGDIMFLSSLEFRFPIYHYIHGAAFADGGNVWLIKKNENFPQGEFKPGKVLNDLAMGAGFGVRLDFSFFILRIDWGLKIKNPARDNQWFNSQDFGLTKGTWNLGIGMPF